MWRNSTMSLAVCAVRVVGKKHQDIEGSLGQLQFLTQRLADMVL